MRYITFFLIVWSLLVHSHRLYAQDFWTAHNDVNQEIKFVNESIHGAMILHRLFETYNQEINQYVDLPSHSINNFGSQDLPQNVYQDPEHWFYPIAPNTLSASILQSGGTPNEFLIRKIDRINNDLNKQRHKIGALIQNTNIDTLSSLQKIYENLEQVTTWYDALQAQVSTYESKAMEPMLSNSLRHDRKQCYTAIVEIHYDIKKALRIIRSENLSQYRQVCNKLSKAEKWLAICVKQLESTQEQQALQPMVSKISQLIAALNSVSATDEPPQIYAHWGLHYYLHNILMLNMLNRYGNGYVVQVNAFFDQYNWDVIHLLEEPHYTKIIYPEIASRDMLMAPPDSVTTIADIRLANGLTSTDTTKTLSPSAPAPKPALDTARDVWTIAAQHTLYVDSLSFSIELFDHKLKDGDRVSINVNGEWTHENISLEKESLTLQLTIAAGQPNTIWIKAINTGYRPPSTIGMRYRKPGEKENKSFYTADLKQDEFLEIKYHLR